MTFIEIIRLIARYFVYIIACAILLSGLVFWSTKNGKKQYSTHTLLNTGLISGYNIESNKSSRVDYAFTNNEIENLINLATSYETNKELSARVIARVLMDNEQGKLPLLPENHEDVRKSLAPLDIQVSQFSDANELYEYLSQVREADQYNPVYRLTNSDDPFFGVEQLETITVMREGSSDMIRMEYSSIDPFMSQYTLELLTEIFISKHKGIKEGQSESVINFFEEATTKTSNKLKNAEDMLLRFRVDNQIINYYEQTRFISGNKEELDKQYQEELKVLAGAESALAKIEDEIADNSMLPLIQTEIADNRQALSGYVSQVSQMELIKDTLPTSSEELITKRILNSRIDSLKASMALAAEKVMMINQTPDGIETKDLLGQWLTNTIAKEESAARLKVMERRQKEYETIYDRFAPLGSTLKRLEREIDVAEREYLENLHSFNQARLHKYNMLMSSNLKVIDAPYYPIKPEKSKRAMMIALAFIVGLVLPAALLIALEMMDSSLKKPENAREATKLAVAGILPKVKQSKKSQKIDFKKLSNQALNLFFQQLMAECPQDTTPKEVIVISMDEGEGKSFLIEQIREYRAQSRRQHLSQLESSLDKAEEEFEFTELPAILHNSYDRKTVTKAQAHVLVCRADRRWTAADKHALKVYKKITGQKPLLLLNGVSTHVMEEIVGEIPRKRSWLRRLVKQLLTQGLKPSTAF